jgi:integrase
MVTYTPLKMTGIFAPLAYDFLEQKRAQGYKYQSEEKILQRFCRFSESFNLETPALSSELVSAWTASRDGEAAKSRLHRSTCTNQFGKYLKKYGYEVCATHPLKTSGTHSFVPYIFTHDEISRLLKAADKVRPIAQSRNMHKVLPVLMRTVYGCGLRVSEAVGMRCKDIDLTDGVLTIREGKFAKDRLTPISGSLFDCLSEYRFKAIDWAEDDDFFFMAPDRTMLSPNTVYGRFRRILQEAEIPYCGKGNGPRLHDIRHSFAVHSLQKWVADGKDLTAMLPVLSVYMGHKSIRATSRYLRLTSEVYPDVIRRVEEVCACVIPGCDAQ